MSELISIGSDQSQLLLRGIGSPEFFEGLLDELDSGIYFVDRNRRILYWNAGAERISGYAATEVVGRCCADQILTHTDGEGVPLCKDRCPLLGVIQDGKPRECSIFLLHKNGHRVPVKVRARPLRDTGGNIVGAVECFADATPEIASLELMRSLEAAAYVDALTGIGNRRYAEEKLCELVAQHRRLGWPAALLFADLDHFKQVNDTYGHAAGDAVLRMVAQTFSQNLRCFDFVGRWGGEEFIILLSGAPDEQLLPVAHRLRALVESSSCLWNGHRIHVTASMGVTAVRCGDTPSTLIERADRLTYEAKQIRNHVVTEAGVAAA